MTASVNRRYIPEVDQIRAIAALLVMLYHGLMLFGPALSAPKPPQWLQPNNPFVLMIQEGHTGVGLFIVLSGFILAVGAVDHVVEYKSFLIARILRIYPLLIVCVVVAMHAAPTNIQGVLTSLLPFNVPGGVAGRFGAMLWTVAIEFQCYLVFPFLIAFSNARGSRFLIELVFIVVAVRLIATFADGANPRDLSYWTVVGRIDQFCIGIIAARLYVHRGALKPAWFALAVAVVLLTFWKFNRLGGWLNAEHWKLLWPTIEGAVWAFFILTYLSAARLFPSWLGSTGAKLGEISYSIYLLHFPVILALIKGGVMIRPTGEPTRDALLTTAFVALPIIVALSVLTYRTIELPFLLMRPMYIDKNK